MFLPTTQQELKQLGWSRLDVILVTGDAYIDSPYIGIAVIGKILLNAGYRVGVIAQPDVVSGADITRLGEPALFWGVSGGCIDSMVANRTASGKRRKRDDYTPGGLNDRRPDRAVIVYSNLIRQHFKQTRPIVLGGIEASLRRVAHYDDATRRIRKSILFDAKADYLLYGMAGESVLELAADLQAERDPHEIRGLCYIAKTAPANCLELPAFQRVAKDHAAFTEMFHTFYRNNDPLTAKPLAQQHDARWLVQNPPAPYPTGSQLDAMYALGYELEAHPFHAKNGEVKALDTIRFSITTHHGCYGECNFCAIAVHQGRTVRWRSRESIVAEVRSFDKHPKFKGIIRDVGGPTANMYGFECAKKFKQGCCADKRCLFPKACPSLKIDHRPQIELLRELRAVKGVRKVFVASGIRYDMIAADEKNGLAYLQELIRHHISGQLKIAPEHTESRVLRLMGKPGPEVLLRFKELFYRLTRKEGRKQFLTYYLIAAHPGCTEKDMAKLRSFVETKLLVLPEQAQIFTPTPSTYSTLMYLTGHDPFTDKPCFVERTLGGKEKQKRRLTAGGGVGKGKGAGRRKRSGKNKRNT